jgi:hypothetical protein
MSSLNEADTNDPLRVTSARRRELLQHFVTPELRQLTRGLLKTKETLPLSKLPLTSKSRQFSPSGRLVRRTSTTNAAAAAAAARKNLSRAQIYRKQRQAQDALKKYRPSEKTNQQAMVQMLHPTKRKPQNNNQQHQRKQHNQQNHKTFSHGNPNKIAASSKRPHFSVFTAEELRHFKRIQKEHEHMLESGHWNGLWEVPRQRRHSTKNRPCLADSRHHSYTLLLGRKPPGTRQTINILNQSDPFTNKSSSSETALKTLAAGVRATHKRDAHGRLAAQRVMMDSTRLYNAALSNSFIAQMLKDDGISGQPSLKYVRERQKRLEEEKQTLNDGSCSSSSSSNSGVMDGLGGSENDGNSSIVSEVMDDADFGVGDLDMAALSKFGVPNAVTRALSVTNSPKPATVDLQNNDSSSFNGKEVGDGDLELELSDGEELSISSSDNSGNIVVKANVSNLSLNHFVRGHHQTSSHGGHIPFSSIAAPSAPLTSASHVAAPQTKSVFNSEKMCWEAPEDDDLMAGFDGSDDSDEDIDKSNGMTHGGGGGGGGDGGRMKLPNGHGEDEDFMAGFDDDSDDEDWG